MEGFLRQVVVPGQARACERRGEGEGRGVLSVSQILVLHLCCNHSPGHAGRIRRPILSDPNQPNLLLLCDTNDDVNTARHIPTLIIPVDWQKTVLDWVPGTLVGYQVARSSSDTPT
jgi:hypothetical protein